MYVYTGVPQHECKVRGPLVGVGALLQLCGFQDQIQIARFGDRSFYPLRYLSDPTYKILKLKFMSNLHLFMESLL